MTIKQNFIVDHLILLILSLITMTFYLPIHGEMDLKLIHPWLDAHGHFFLKDHWALKSLAHEYIKYILIAVYLSILGIFIASYKVSRLKPYRFSALYAVFMVMLSTSLIGLIKSHSDYACPWNMITPTQLSYAWNFHLTAGHCFPGGHASTGFALMVGYFLYRQTDRAQAYFYLVASLILGFAMGWGQMMRGAHFMTHNLWSGWITWCLNIIMYLIFKYILKVKFLNPTYPISN